MKITTFVLLSLQTFANQIKGREGISFVVVGDWGNMFELERPKSVFDAINQMKADAQPGSPEDFQFFTTVGDNIYPKNESEPTKEELEESMNMFLKREHIKDLPIYPIRGNHDCYFDDQEYEIKLSKLWPQWKMDSNYYLKEWDIGEGEKFSLMQVDSCLLLCQSIGSGPLPQKNFLFLMSLDAESREIYQSRCEGDKSYVAKGDEMMKWIHETLEKQSKDKKIAWKASGMHHPMFGIFYQDYHAIVNDFMPRIQEHNYDVFFNGHEHLNSYSSLFRYEKLQEMQYVDGQGCQENAEWFLTENASNKVSEKQGDKLHQITLGMSGRHPYDLCVSNLKSSQGAFLYGQNRYQSFGLVHITPEEFKIIYKGVEVPPSGNQLNKKLKIKDLFEVTIKRDRTYPSSSAAQKSAQNSKTSKKHYQMLDKFIRYTPKPINRTQQQLDLKMEMKQLNNNINEFDSFLKQHGVKLENHKSNDTTILQSNLNTYINRTHSVVSELHKKTQKDLKEAHEMMNENKKDLKKINSDVKSIVDDMDDINKFIKENEGKTEKASSKSKENKGKGQCKQQNIQDLSSQSSMSYDDLSNIYEFKINVKVI